MKINFNVLPSFIIMDKTAIIIIIVIILAGVLFWAFQSGFLAKIFPGSIKPNTMPEGIVLFYGEGCPHCKDVEDFVSQNKIEDKVKFTRLEVWNNQNNALLLINTAQSCEVDISQGAPVPLLWDGTKCYIGGPDVINFFKNAAGIE